MKLSFTTRGWQELGWEELLSTAEECGLNGIELYDLQKRKDLTDRGGALVAMLKPANAPRLVRGSEFPFRHLLETLAAARAAVCCG